MFTPLAACRYHRCPNPPVNVPAANAYNHGQSQAEAKSRTLDDEKRDQEGRRKRAARLREQHRLRYTVPFTVFTDPRLAGVGSPLRAFHDAVFPAKPHRQIHPWHPLRRQKTILIDFSAWSIINFIFVSRHFRQRRRALRHGRKKRPATRLKPKQGPCAPALQTNFQGLFQFRQNQTCGV